MAKVIEAGNWVSTEKIKQVMQDLFFDGDINEELRAIITSKLMQEQEYLEVN
jgi:hypothetical protein